MKIEFDTNEFTDQLRLKVNHILILDQYLKLFDAEKDKFEVLFDNLINTLKMLPSKEQVDALDEESRKKFYAAIDGIYMLASDLISKLYNYKI